MQGIPVRLPKSLLARSHDKVLVCIPSAFRDVLLSMAGDSLLWDATWLESPLSHEQQLFINGGIADLQADFGDCETMDGTLTEILDKLNELEAKMCCCCGCGGSGCGSSDVDQTQPSDGTQIVNPGNGSDVQPTDPNYDQYKCDVSHWLFANGIEWATQLRNLVASGQTEYQDALNIWEAIFGVMLTAVAFPVLLVWGVYYALMVWALQSLTEEVSNQWIAQMNAKQDELICAMLESVNEQDAYSKVTDVIITMAMPYLYRIGLIISIQAWSWEVIFLEELERPPIPTEYMNSTCNCTGGGGTELPAGCTSDAGGFYPAITDFCYRQIDAISYVATINDNGQQYIISGRDLNIFGSNHPGNVEFGFSFNVNTRPSNALGLIFTVQKADPSSSTAATRIGNQAAITNPLCIGGNTGTQDVAEQTFVAYVATGTDARTQPIADAVTAGDIDQASANLQASGAGGTNIFLGVEAAGGLFGTSYNNNLIAIAWLVYTGA